MGCRCEAESLFIRPSYEYACSGDIQNSTEGKRNPLLVEEGMFGL